MVKNQHGKSYINGFNIKTKGLGANGLVFVSLQSTCFRLYLTLPKERDREDIGSIRARLPR